MPEITRTKITFTYDVPDQYLYQTNTLKKTNEWTYEGPDKFWIFIDNETKKINSRFHYTERDNGADVPSPEGMTKVLVDANVNPVLASLIYTEVDYGSLPHTTENLPEGQTYGHPVPLPPDHTYEITEIVYNAETGEFVTPYPWKKPHMDWDTLIAVRNNMLLSSDTPYAVATGELKDQWAEYRQKLRELPTTFAGVDPWKVAFPLDPNTAANAANVG